MLRNYLVLACLIGSLCAKAQTSAQTPVTTAEANAAPEVDYKILGAPMPLLKIVSYRDSGTKKVAKEAGEVPKPKKKKKHGEPASSPASGHFVTSADLDNNANLFVMIFNPNCSHCEEETKMIEKNSALFKNTKLVMVANPRLANMIPNFVSNNSIPDYPFISIGPDSSDYINKVILYKMLPQINIYDHDRKLIKCFNGDMPIDSLQQYIQ